MIKIGEEKNKEIDRRDALIGKLVEALEDHKQTWDETFQMWRRNDKVIEALAEARKFQGNYNE